MIGRIHERTIFGRLRREGVTVRCGPLWCSVLLDSSLSMPHVAYALGRSTGSAVVRNRLRRRLRSLMHSSGHMMSPGWYLLGADSRATAMTFDELSAQTTELLNRAVAKAERRSGL